MAVMNMVQAINSALSIEMEKDSTVMILGEDVGRDGGVFRVTDGLWQKFGGNRVVDTPLAEAGILGVSIGLAANGFKPVAEAQFDGFSIPMLDQLINHVGRLRNRTRGRFHLPLVLRFPCSGGIRALEHHSDSPETYYVHTPGIKVVMPSTPYDAKGLMISAIRDPDPVVFMEPKRLYRSVKEDVPEEEYMIPIGEANVLQEGSDLSIISYGTMVKVAKSAAEKLSGKYSAEVIDLRTLSPLDMATVIASVEKTGRAVIVHEAPRTLGIGAEVAAQIAEKALLSLKAPVVRVTGYDIIYPLPKLENRYIPSEERVVKAVEQVMGF